MVPAPDAFSNGAGAMMDISASLSPRQSEALHIDDDAILTAGAGAGKTRTLVALVCRDLLVDRIDPQQILVCTFTRAAAANLLSKIAQGLDELDPHHHIDVERMHIGTIDALCTRLLHEHALDAQLSPGFSVADDRLVMQMNTEAFEHALMQLPDSMLHALDGVVDTSSGDFAVQVAAVHERLVMQQLPVDVQQLTGAAISQGDATLMHDVRETLAQESLRASAAKKIAEDLTGMEAEDPLLFSNAKYGFTKKDVVPDVIERIARHRQHLIDASCSPAKEAVASLLEAFADYIGRYKQQHNCLAFVDLVPAVDRLLDVRPDLASMTRVYVDEAQDTNPMQLRVLERLRCSTGRILSVGDASQSIYGFRNADIEGFRKQKQRAAQHLTLDENYRSHPSIVEVINSLCSGVDGLRDDVVSMQSMRERGTSQEPRVHLMLHMTPDKAPDATAEAAMVVPHVLALAQEREVPLSEVAILCRTNADCEAYSHALKQAGVPVVLTQKRGLLARSEVQDAIAYLALIARPDDEQALLRVLTSPFVSVSDRHLYELTRNRSDEPLWHHVAQSLPEFAARVNETRTLSLHRRPSQLLIDACEHHGFDLTLEMLDATGSMWRNIEKLASNIEHIERELEGSVLSAVVRRLEAETQLGLGGGQDTRATSNDAVQVMTVHNAKGAEFGMTVCGRMNKRIQSPPGQVIWLNEDGQLGLKLASDAYDSIALHQRKRTEQAEEAEGKRLMYVALTRAQDELVFAVSGRVKKDGTVTLNGPAHWLLNEGMPALGALEAEVVEEDELVIREVLTSEHEPPIQISRIHMRSEQDET